MTTTTSTPTSPLLGGGPPSTATTPTVSSGSTLGVGGGTDNNCHGCGQLINTPQFVRVGVYKFHRDHFTCCVCSKNLHGQKFHHKDQKFYCADDYVKKFCYTCRQCGEKISSGSMIQAFGGYYHHEHFVCTTCNTPFKNSKYYEVNNLPYCEEHYYSMVAEKCDVCKLPVKENELTRVATKAYHEACLTCYHCRQPLSRLISIFHKDNHIFCKTDYLNLFCKRCTACGDHIVKHCVSVNDEFYHPECLKCSVCEKKLEKYICIAGYLRCAEHTEVTSPVLRCSVCTLDIVGDVVLSSGLKLHEDCFNCSICRSRLQKASCKMKDGKLCCGTCMQVQTPSSEGRSRAQTASPSSTSSPSATAPSTPSQSSTSATDGKRRTDETNGDGGESKDNKAPEKENGEQKKKKKKSSSRGNANHKRSLTNNSQLSRPLPAIPQRIEWRRGDLIGKGSFGKVYMGMNVVTGELLAVKTVILNSTEDEEQAAAIQGEINLMENLRHPNIVALLGTERDGKKTEYTNGIRPGQVDRYVVGTVRRLLGESYQIVHEAVAERVGLLPREQRRPSRYQRQKYSGGHAEQPQTGRLWVGQKVCKCVEPRRAESELQLHAAVDGAGGFGRRLQLQSRRLEHGLRHHRDGVGQAAVVGGEL